MAGETPILRSEVERLADWIELFDPGKVRDASRRGALTTVLLSQAAVANRFPTARKDARATAEARLAALRDQPDAPSGTHQVEGGWLQLGLVLWGEARDLPPDTWAGPFEEIGRFFLARKTATRPGTLAGADEFTLDVIDVPFVPPDFAVEDMESTLDTTPLSILDPAIGELVPAMWRYRMRAAR